MPSTDSTRAEGARHAGSAPAAIENDAAALRDALLWATGSPTARFRLRPEQYATFFEAAKLHRISGRLLRRLRAETSSVSHEFLAEALRLHEFTTTLARKNMEVADTLGRAMRKAGADEHLILLKGFTLYAFTGDPLDLRLSGDLDVSVADLIGFIEVAEEHGFRHVRPLDHLAEFAVMVSPENAMVELHSRFDITGPDRNLSQSDIDPDKHPALWEQRRHFRVRYVRPRDMAKNLGHSSVIPDTVRPLSPEMAALVSAAHMYKNFLRTPYPLPFATIPLDEIATFRDLCWLPAFDPVRFAALIEEFDGHTAVFFARSLASDLLGDDQLPRNANSALLPGSLWWDGLDGGGFPVDLGWDPLQFVYRDRPISETIEALRPLDVSGAATAYQFSFRLLGAEGDSGAKRYIFRKMNDSNFAADCTISVRSDELRFSIRIPRLARDRMGAIAICLEDYRYEMFLNCSARDYFVDYSAKRDAAQEIAVNRYTDPEGDGIDLKLPARVVQNCAHNGAVHALMVVREQLREWGQITAGVATPLRIHIPA